MKPHTVVNTFLGASLAVSSLALMSCGGASHYHDVTESFYLVASNNKVSYWQTAAAGLTKAAAQMDVKAEMVGSPTYDPKTEHEEFQRIIAKKPSGILVSVSDASVIAPDIDAAIAQGIPVITMDSDAPASKRLLFIGTNNYDAGKMGGQLLVKLLNGKGTVVVFTIPEQENLKERLRGYKSVLETNPGIKITEVIDTRGAAATAFDKTTEIVEKAKTQPDAFVCLESVSGAEVADVLERKKVTGKIIVAMDTDPKTLQFVQKGVISATIAQKPFTMAYYGVKILDDLVHHKLQTLTADFPRDSFSPIPMRVDTGATLIDKSNVDGFLKAQQDANAGH
jgi:ribose transport system substrate-binding protein